MTDRVQKQYEAMRDHFHRAAEQRGFTLDPAQQPPVERLSRLAGELAHPAWRLHRPPRHLYLWGPVGRGKSWLVDTFLDGLPTPRKRRLHFHSFFRRLHDGVAHHAGSRTADGSAVDRAVDELLGDCRILVFDEFHAHDAGDAMLVARLFHTLLDRRITLVTTSNYPPAGLMPDPLYHHLFEPTIKLIEERMDVLDVSGPVDFRRQQPRSDGAHGFGLGARLHPGDEAGAGLTPPRPEETTLVTAHHRDLPARAVRDDLVWFGFAELCEGLTSVADYLALAERFPAIVLDGVPALTEASPDGRRRFANLVDVCCDRDVPLTLIGADPLAGLPAGSGLMRDLDRTASRLALLRPPATLPGR
ncbi:cell division protein ZapE [Kitasatospora gansuensis]|uniref:Cell division protein ZapE n=2 Tax=Kitasatospora TaxID=2063 RepID=A0A7W7SG70_9ACTN|nr:cell division protein ZapE [Kitasatospora gansuensis]MBB4949870.1 cell division protein ZapE [Kitasatospora gansuensis]